jgi:hypothetical protein
VRLSAGSPTRNEETFIEGVRQAAVYLNLNTIERAQHFGHELKGIYYPNKFTASWNRLFPEQRIAWWEPDATRCCAENWVHVVDNGSWKLVHQQTGHFCQGMNEVFLGPTTLDCGMATEYLILMGCRWVFGDADSDKVFPGHLAFSRTPSPPMIACHVQQKTWTNLLRPIILVQRGLRFLRRVQRKVCDACILPRLDNSSTVRFETRDILGISTRCRGRQINETADHLAKQAVSFCKP